MKRMTNEDTNTLSLQGTNISCLLCLKQFETTNNFFWKRYKKKSNFD